MSYDNARSVLQEFGTKVGLPQIDFNEEGLCSLHFDEVIVNLELSSDGEILTFYLWIATVAEEQKSEAALILTDANYLLIGSHGTTLGMNRHSGDVALAWQTPTLGINIIRLEQIFENVVNLAEQWRTRLANLGTEKDTLSPSETFTILI